MLQDTSSNLILQSALKAMSADTVIWKKYFNDFSFYKLGLDSEGYQESFSQQILHTLLCDVIGGDSVDRLVSLHIYFYVFKLNISQIASVLRPLNKLDKVSFHYFCSHYKCIHGILKKNLSVEG